MTTRLSDREVMTMAAEGGLRDFDDLLKLFDVIEQRVQEGKKMVKALNEEARAVKRSGMEIKDE